MQYFPIQIIFYDPVFRHTHVLLRTGVRDHGLVLMRGRTFSICGGLGALDSDWQCLGRAWRKRSRVYPNT